MHDDKKRRVSVGYGIWCLIGHKDRLNDSTKLSKPLLKSNVVIYEENKAYEMLKNNYPAELLEKATEDSFGTEFLDYKMSIKTINDLDEALNHIQKYSSKHSECIVTENKDTANTFCQLVDAACVYVNVSTAFTDGAQFGLGAEIGISTQKLHARGPMALEEITSYKWIIEGDGQTRS